MGATTLAHCCTHLTKDVLRHRSAGTSGEANFSSQADEHIGAQAYGTVAALVCIKRI